jgi:phenylacetate-CoA ligase
MREYFDQRWKLPLTDVYTARETGYMALQCPDGDGYHAQSESAFVEVLNENGTPCAAGEIGRVVVTPLHNFAMPLIRYDIGDYAEVGPQCSCGRGLPVLRRILGRTRNILRLPDGSMRWPTLGTDKLPDIAPISRIKVIQKSLTEIEVRLIAMRPFSDSEFAALREHFLKHFGPHFNWRFVFLDEFPPQAGDKFEDFVSEVA